LKKRSWIRRLALRQSRDNTLLKHVPCWDVMVVRFAQVAEKEAEAEDLH
jgi:hypothetical protein